ncbi:hypothetical protein ABG067_007926, partial [Albugo candida]
MTNNDNNSSSSSSSSQQARGPNTTPGQMKAFVNFFERHNNYFLAFAGISNNNAPLSGSIIRKGEVYDFMHQQLQKDKSIPPEWTKEILDLRVNRHYTKYKEVNRMAGNTGFGVTDDDRKKGIMTVEDKLEDLCPGYEKYFNLLGGRNRQNTNPHRVSMHGAPGGSHFTYSSTTAPIEAQRDAVFREQEAAERELRDMLGRRDTPSSHPSSNPPSNPPSNPSSIPIIDSSADDIFTSPPSPSAFLYNLGSSRRTSLFSNTGGASLNTEGLSSNVSGGTGGGTFNLPPRRTADVPSAGRGRGANTSGPSLRRTDEPSAGRGRGRGRGRGGNLPRNDAPSVSRSRVDPDAASRNKRMKKDFSSEYREAQLKKNEILN